MLGTEARRMVVGLWIKFVNLALPHLAIPDMSNGAVERQSDFRDTTAAEANQVSIVPRPPSLVIVFTCIAATENENIARIRTPLAMNRRRTCSGWQLERQCLDEIVLASCSCQSPRPVCCTFCVWTALLIHSRPNPFFQMHHTKVSAGKSVPSPSE